MINFSKNDFSKLVDLVSNLDEFRMENSRWRLIDDILIGYSREKDIRKLLDLGGTPRSSAISLINSFLKFGQIEHGTELIGVLSNRLLDSYIFDPDSISFLRELFVNYPLDKVVADKGEIELWKGNDTTEDIEEKIIGENTLMDVANLELALIASLSVVRVHTAKNLGSGFLCGANLIMTNCHVIPNIETAQNSKFEFFYELDRNLQEKPSQILRPQKNGFFFCNTELDFALVEIEKTNMGISPLCLRKGGVSLSDRVNIIQHPGGHYKKISMQNNFIEYIDSKIIQYTTSTEPGSSGSPVLNNKFEVIALHHGGGVIKEPNSMRRYLRNEGIMISAILQEIETRYPEIIDNLKIVNK